MTQSRPPRPPALLLASLLIPSVLVAPARTAAQATRDRPFLGVFTEPLRADDPKGGLRVTFVFPDSAAMEMGLQKGDEIIALNDTLITDQDTFIGLLRRENVGATLRFFVRRGGEKIRIKGKIGGHDKTLTRYQERVRARMVGKPFPKPPAVKWWNPATGDWTGKDGLADVEGKLTVVISFDACPVCKEKRYATISAMQRQFVALYPNARLGFVGLYLDNSDPTGKPPYFETAKEFLTAIPPPFPVGAVFYPDGAPSPEARNAQIHIHYHGVAILDGDGLVRYVEFVEPPGPQFAKAYQDLMQGFLGDTAK